MLYHPRGRVLGRQPTPAPSPPQPHLLPGNGTDFRGRNVEGLKLRLRLFVQFRPVSLLRCGREIKRLGGGGLPVSLSHT